MSPAYVIITRSRRLITFAANFLRHVRTLLALALAGVAVCAGATGLPPDVLSIGGLRAPFYQILNPAGGTNNYQGKIVTAGEYLIETDPYDLLAGQPRVRFNVRNASDRSLRYRLDPLVSGGGVPDAEVFADTREFAIRTRDVANGSVQVSIYDLDLGNLRIVLTQPSAQAGDDFGSNVWFTETHILVAAPGRDFRKRDAGAIYLFDRFTGRHKGTVGPGVKEGTFGSAPVGSQPFGVPYVQSSGSQALIVHGSNAYRLAGERLQSLSLPSKATLNAAFIADGRIILGVTETTNRGRSSRGRVIAYDLATGRLRYQLTGIQLGAAAFSGPSLGANAGRLFAFLTSTGDSPRNVLRSFRISDGALIKSIEWADSTGVTMDGNSLTFSADKLWLRSFTAVPGKASKITWIAHDPATLAETLRLTPPGEDRFIGVAPQPVGGGRLGVASSRTTSGTILTPFAAEKTTSTSSSSFNISDPSFSPTTFGVLVFDPTKSEWTHRLFLEGEFANIHGYQYLYSLRPLRAAPGIEPLLIDVTHASGAVTEIASYDLALPDTTPATTLEGRLSFTLNYGYHYALHRSATPATEFTLHSELGLGDGALHEDVVPYLETLGEVAYRLDGDQFSRRIYPPAPDPLTIGPLNVSDFAVFQGKVAASVQSEATLGSSYYRPPMVKILDLATRETLLTVYPGRNGSVALNDRFLAVGDFNYDYAGRIDIYDASSGKLLRSLSGEKRFGNNLALSGDRLVTTSVATSYISQTGTYTHTSQVSAYSLPDGRLLYTRPLATLTNTLSWSHPPTDLVVTADSIVVLASSADGPVRVLDLASGDTRYNLASPTPQPRDYFGGWLAAGGDYLAVGSTGTSEVFVFDLPTGNLLHTLILYDRPEGIVNYGTWLPRLSIDATNHRLSWMVEEDLERNRFNSRAVYLFDLSTGLEEAKVIASPDGVTLAGDRLLAVTRSGSLLEYPLTEALATPLTTSSDFLAPTPAIRLKFPTRRGINYQPEVSADSGSTWTALGAPYSGDGQPATLRRSLTGLPAPETLRFRLQPAWK